MAVFVLIFLQETGVPNPIPNELLIMFSGYLSFIGFLYFPFVFLVVISADFIGTNILYLLFYSLGPSLISRIPRWFPVSKKTLNRLNDKIKERGYWNIYVFRLTPFTRGYTSVLSGLVRIRPGIFLPIVLASSVTWAGVYLTIGYVAGPSWHIVSQNIHQFKLILLSILGLAIVIVIINHFIRKNKRSQKDKVSADSI